jgi:NADPH:quinone reductase-like Zn-dependent oxidoreductase
VTKYCGIIYKERILSYNITIMIQISSPGGYDKLEYKSLSVAKYTIGANVKHSNIPEEDLVTVQTCAAGVNYADVCVRWGVYESAKEHVGWPITPGFEFSGKIIAKGENVSEFECGESVFGLTMFGGYSEVVKVPKNQLFPMPKNLDLKQAAGFPTVAITAWYAMFELARPRPGSWILVHSAAGGVGSMLVQMAKIAKCNVVGVVGASHKVNVVKETLGIYLN